MREIKFRAWNPETKEMYSRWIDTAFGYENWTAVNDGAPYEEKVVLMQFTGLLDKNGKEIYEGDIVGYWGGNKNGARWIVGWDDNKSGWAAVYGETDITDLGESMSGRPAFKLSKKLCEKKEIIGNIYENPELLTNK